MYCITPQPTIVVQWPYTIIKSFLKHRLLGVGYPAPRARNKPQKHGSVNSTRLSARTRVALGRGSGETFVYIAVQEEDLSRRTARCIHLYLRRWSTPHRENVAAGASLALSTTAPTPPTLLTTNYSELERTRFFHGYSGGPVVRNVGFASRLAVLFCVLSHQLHLISCGVLFSRSKFNRFTAFIVSYFCMYRKNRISRTNKNRELLSSLVDVDRTGSQGAYWWCLAAGEMTLNRP